MALAVGLLAYARPHFIRTVPKGRHLRFTPIPNPLRFSSTTEHIKKTRLQKEPLFFYGSGGRIRTYDRSVNSR